MTWLAEERYGFLAKVVSRSTRILKIALILLSNVYPLCEVEPFPIRPRSNQALKKCHSWLCKLSFPGTLSLTAFLHNEVMTVDDDRWESMAVTSMTLTAESCTSTPSSSTSSEQKKTAPIQGRRMEIIRKRARKYDWWIRMPIPPGRLLGAK